MSGGEFETALTEYVTSVERFVQTMHDGLIELTSERLSSDLDAAGVARLEDAERQVAEKLEAAEPVTEAVTAFHAEIEIKNIEVRSLLAQLEEKKAECEAKTAELEEKNLELIEATAALEKKSSEREQALAAELAERSARLEEHLATLRAKEEEIVRLQAQIAEFAAQELARREAVAEEQPHDTHDLNEIVELRNQVAELEALRAQVAELKSLEAEAADLRAQAVRVSTLETRITELETELESQLTETAAPRVRTRAPRPVAKFSSRKKVLVVEPTEVQRVLFGRSFHGLPLEIRFARNADEADRLQGETSFDLVVTDWSERLRQGLPRQELVGQVLARLDS